MTALRAANRRKTPSRLRRRGRPIPASGSAPCGVRSEGFTHPRPKSMVPTNHQVARGGDVARHVLTVLGVLGATCVLTLTLGLATEASAATCETGFLALERGDLEAARTFFESANVEPECRVAGLEVVQSREQAAKDALGDCDALLEKANAAAGNAARKVLDDAEERCLVATTLDPESTDAQAALAKVRAAQKAAAEPPSTTDEIVNFSSSAWDVAKRLLAVVGTWLAAIVIVLPILAIIQFAIGRVGRVTVSELRLVLRQERGLRIAIEIVLAAAIIGVLTGQGHLPIWAAALLVIAGIAVSLSTARLASEPADKVAWGLIALVFLTILPVAIWLIPSGNGLAVAAGLAVLLIALAWVRAQTSALRIGVFGDASGKTDPPTTFGPLLAAELRRLVRPGRASLDIVDAALASAVVDADSLNAFTSPESKLLGAVAKVASSFARPSDYTVSGFLVEETDNGVGVTVQLKRGPVLLDAVTVFAREFALLTELPQNESDKGAANDTKDGKASADKENTDRAPAKHPDLATAAACWVLARFTEELLVDTEAIREALNGVSDWRSVAYETVASRLLAAGEVVRAAEMYGRAVDADRDNLAAIFGLAQAGYRQPLKAEKSLEISALRAAAEDATSILQRSSAEDDKELRIRAAYLFVAALANEHALINDEPGQGDRKLALRTCIGRVIDGDDEQAPLSPGVELARGVLKPVLDGQPDDVSNAVLDHLNTQAQSALAPLQDEFADAEDDQTALKDIAPALVQQANETLRGQYNLAAWYAKSLPRAGELLQERRANCIQLLLRVTCLPELAAFARTDPYFIPMRTDPAFRQLVGTPPAVKVSGGELSEFVLIGKKRAERLANAGIMSFAELETKSAAQIRAAFPTGSLSDGLIERWRAASRLFMLPDLAVRGLNALTIAGVGSVEDLANRDPVELTKLVDAAAGGLDANEPSEGTVTGWVASAALAAR
jgi:hypothetical protein